ncbi:MAG: peptide chain release factor-like protein [Gemmatimonadales bacterium]|nr:MAG: peptide chain release factor-like protein [Gemmatimonadales bacterium]
MNGGEGSTSDAELLAQCRVDTFRSGGKGGQHQNTTDSGVRLTHLPTGIVVTAREQRSQLQNRRVALDRLRRKIREQQQRKKPRLGTRIPKREKARRLREKRAQSEKKARRKPPSRDE